MPQIFAQAELLEAPVTIATYIDVSGEDVQDGSIVSSSPEGIVVSNKPYDTDIYGVVVFNPAVALNDVGKANAYPIVSTGSVRVRVTTANGVLRKGDYITSSDRPGIGMKATRTGYVLGQTLEDFDGGEVDEGLVLVALRASSYIAPGDIGSNLRDVINLSSDIAYQQPLLVFKYVIAAIVLIGSVLLGIFYFGRIAISGIEALGRNPLAGGRIQVGVFISIALAICVIGAGVAVAIFILRF